MPHLRHGPTLRGNERQTIMMFGLLELFLILPLLGLGRADLATAPELAERGSVAGCARLGLLLLAVGFWLWMLVDCVPKESSVGNDKFVGC